jgi:hypothetical protein
MFFRPDCGSRTGVLVLATLLVVSLVGCGTAARTVRLDTGGGKLLVHVPRGGEEPARLRENELEEAMTKLVRDVRPASNPLRHARRLMFESPWQEEVFLKWTGQRLVLDSQGREERYRGVATDGLTSEYGRWCEYRGRSRDCRSLLKEGPVLTAEGRYTLAMEFAIGSVWSVWNETMDAFKHMANPEAVRATIVSAMAMYMMLWLLPEPTSKGLAATLTVGLIAYLGVDTVWSLIQGWMQLVEAANHATTLNELREAGERFGRVMGQDAARLFVMLATAAIGNTVGLAVKGPGLPGSSRAAVLAESQGGFRFMAMAEVESVAISSEGVFTIALAPGALAMTAQVMGRGAPAPVDAAGHEHHIATDKWNDAAHSGGPWTPKFKEIFDRAGMSMNDPANKVHIKGHRGPHPQEYHEEVYERLDRATSVCRTTQQCQQALTAELRRLAQEISTPGSRLNKVVTRGE